MVVDVVSNLLLVVSVNLVVVAGGDYLSFLFLFFYFIFLLFTFLFFDLY